MKYILGFLLIIGMIIVGLGLPDTQLDESPEKVPIVAVYQVDEAGVIADITLVNAIRPERLQKEAIDDTQAIPSTDNTDAEPILDTSPYFKGFYLEKTFLRYS